MRSASSIISLSTYDARVPGFSAMAGETLNDILSELCQEYDLDQAKKNFNFTFTGATAPIGNLNVQLASGPFPLPMDYLRAKLGDVLYFPQGLGQFSLKLTPIDLAEFDARVQQAGFNNFPVFFATDMSNAQVVLATTGTTTSGSTTLSGLGSTTGLATGQSVYGPGLPPGTTVASYTSGSGCTLSEAALGAYSGQSYVFGVPPVCYVWPPASGAYPCLVRYYSQMPDIPTPETSAQIPWFPNQQFLRTELSGRLMQQSGDGRWEAFLSDNEELHPAGSRVLLRRYLTMKDDSTNRAKRITLDPRRFGSDWNRLPRSKVFGY